MLDQGRVFKVEKNIAWVEFAASSACASCGSCHRVSSGKMVTKAQNDLEAKVGDLVEVEISQAVATLFPLIVFGIPILFLFLGLVIGSFISEMAGIVLGVVFLILGFLSVRLIDRYVAKQKKFQSRIVRIIGRKVSEMAKDPVCGMEVKGGEKR